MPSSRPTTIPTVINLLRQFKPQSILDVGVGFGKWGHLFREYTDILQAEHDPARYQRANWKVRIDGIEGYASYVTEMHRFLYNELFIGNALELIHTVPQYDLIFLGDIIEHFEKKDGINLLGTAVRKAAKAVIVSTPKFETGQEDLCGNELEKHRSLWSARDFRKFQGAMVKTVDQDTLLAVIVKEGVGPPDFDRPKRRDLVQLQSARVWIDKLIPPADALILVDDEQLRHRLKERPVFPFIEREGQYWGPPADAETAIAELERLRSAGAKYIAFIASTFWWLQHYGPFAEHLRSHYHCVAENKDVIIFRLTEAVL
jgi:hypothetical protein